MKTVVVLCLAAAFLADVSTKKDKKEPIWWEKFHDVEEKLEALHSIVHGLQQQIEDCCNKTDCDYNGTKYNDGESFPKGDGCNTCFCKKGVVGCTKRYCNQGGDWLQLDSSQTKSRLELYSKVNMNGQNRYYGPTCLNGTCRVCNETGVMTIDLNNGAVVGSLTDVIVESKDLPINSSIPCCWRALLKVSFQPKSAEMCRNLLKVQMKFGSCRQDTMFNFGDSSSNNGYGGDGSTQSRNAEIDAVNGNVGIWGSDHSGPSPPPTVQLSNHTDAVGSGRTFITLWISHNYYRLKNNQIDTEMCSDCFYDLNDGNNREGSVNRDFWLAFNRAVSGMSSRNGYGTCNVKLSWVCNVPGND